MYDGQITINNKKRYFSMPNVLSKHTQALLSGDKFRCRLVSNKIYKWSVTDFNNLITGLINHDRLQCVIGLLRNSKERQRDVCCFSFV